METRSVLQKGKRRNCSAKKIQLVFRDFCARKTNRRSAKMVFFLNPYDKKIDLSSRDGLKLYADAKRGLEKEDRFDGSKEKYSKFSKLMGKVFKTYRMMEIYRIPTVWEATTPSNPTLEGMVNLFESNAATKEQVKAQADKVWEETTHGADTPKYFKIFGTKPTNDDELDEARNNTKLKHAMAGSSIWNSLTSDF